jgi:signal transduction histidine kinase
MEAVWSALAEHRGKVMSERRIALGIAGAFSVAGVAWVLSTDILLYSLTSDPALIGRLETAKGWLFVLFSAVVIYLLAHRSALRITRARAAMAAVVDSIADGVLLLGRDRHVAYANPAAARMLNCEAARELIGMSASVFSRRFRVSYTNGSLVPPDEFVSQRVFDEGGPLRYKALIHPPQGGELVVSVVGAAVRLRAGIAAELVVSVMHDITDSENLERLRDQFFAAAAHALKTPVAVIKANAQLMSRRQRVENGHATPAHAQAMAAITRQCSRIDRMVQNMLVLSRARSRSLRLYLDEVELAPLVSQIAREMAADERRNDIHAEVTSSPRVIADPERLGLVLRNVIEEAQRGSVAGTPVIVRVTQQGQDAEITVAYHALPIEEGPFAAADEYDNLGIGRSVAETIVEAHGGALRAERSGPEATAYIRLPVSVEASP